MTKPTDAQIALMFSFYEGVLRKGPGSEAATLKALSMLDRLSPNPRVVDFGCGAGVASLVLANAIECSVTAVDIHQPFLDELNTIAVREGLSGRITTVQADMSDPSFPNGSFDLIWSEGAIYNIGFQDGLKSWRRLLRSGGYVAVTEVTWLSETPPQKAVGFWKSEYPSITHIADNLSKVRSAGFETVGHFILPSEDWQNYYGPLQEQLVAFRSKHPANAEAQALADSVQQEIDVWRECGPATGTSSILAGSFDQLNAQSSCLWPANRSGVVYNKLCANGRTLGEFALFLQRIWEACGCGNLKSLLQVSLGGALFVPALPDVRSRAPRLLAIDYRHKKWRHKKK